MLTKKKVLPAPTVVSPELTDEFIRLRAYQLFEQRGYEHGHDVEDWLEAKTEILSKKPGSPPDQTKKTHAATAA